MPFCIAAIVLMLRYVRESRDETAVRHIDVAGMLALTGSLVCISLAFDRGEDWGWTSGATVGTLVLGVALLVLFVVIEGRVRAPLVDLALFRNRPAPFQAYWWQRQRRNRGCRLLQHWLRQAYR